MSQLRLTREWRSPVPLTLICKNGVNHAPVSSGFLSNVVEVVDREPRCTQVSNAFSHTGVGYGQDIDYVQHTDR